MFLRKSGPISADHEKAYVKLVHVFRDTFLLFLAFEVAFVFEFFSVSHFSLAS